MKLASMFFTASASTLEACFKLRISERETKLMEEDEAGIETWTGGKI